jgi:hypothetical protein
MPIYVFDTANANRFTEAPGIARFSVRKDQTICFAVYIS